MARMVAPPGRARPCSFAALRILYEAGTRILTINQRRTVNGSGRSQDTKQQRAATLRVLLASIIFLAGCAARPPVATTHKIPMPDGTFVYSSTCPRSASVDDCLVEAARTCGGKYYPVEVGGKTAVFSNEVWFTCEPPPPAKR